MGEPNFARDDVVYNFYVAKFKATRRKRWGLLYKDHTHLRRFGKVSILDNVQMNGVVPCATNIKSPSCPHECSMLDLVCFSMFVCDLWISWLGWIIVLVLVGFVVGF